MKETKKARIETWIKAFNGHITAFYNDGMHLRLKVGERQVDVWPTTGRYCVNNSYTSYAHTPAQIVLEVKRLPDEPPASQVQKVAPQTVVQFKVFGSGRYGSTPFEEANTWLAEQENVEYVDFKILPVYHDGGTLVVPDYEERIVLVYKTSTP